MFFRSSASFRPYWHFPVYQTELPCIHGTLNPRPICHTLWKYAGEFAWLHHRSWFAERLRRADSLSSCRHCYQVLNPLPILPPFSGYGFSQTRPRPHAIVHGWWGDCFHNCDAAVYANCQRMEYQFARWMFRSIYAISRRGHFQPGHKHNNHPLANANNLVPSYAIEAKSLAVGYFFYWNHASQTSTLTLTARGMTQK